MKIKKTILAFLIITSSVIAEENKLDSLIVSGIHQIYSIQFEEAENTFEVVRSEFPEHPSGKFFDAMVVWWRILLDLKSEVFDDLLIEKLDEVIEQCDDILDDDPDNVDAIFFKGGALGYRGRLSALRGAWFDAAADGKDALPLVFWAYDLDSTNTDVVLGFGIYNYFAEIIPEIFPAVEPLMVFFPAGDKEKGLEQLEFVAQNGKYAKYEALYFLMTSYYSFEKNYNKALHYAKILNEEFPNNPRFEGYRGRINVRKNNYEKAAKIFTDIIKKYDLGFTGYTEKVKREAEYYVAVYNFNSDSLSNAEVHFKNCETLSRKIEIDEPSGFLVNSLIYLGKINDISGKREIAVKYYEEVLELDEYRNSHKTAERFLKKPYGK